jgi:hypothetical protein
MADRKTITVQTALSDTDVYKHFSAFGPIKHFYKNALGDYEIQYVVMPSVRHAVENSDLYTYRVWPKVPLPVYARSSRRSKHCA